MIAIQRKIVRWFGSFTPAKRSHYLEKNIQLREGLKSRYEEFIDEFFETEVMEEVHEKDHELPK